MICTIYTNILYMYQSNISMVPFNLLLYQQVGMIKVN